MPVNLEPRPLARSLARASVLALLLAACGGSRSGTNGADGAAFPEYSATDAVLFDDMLAPALFGFDPEARTPAKDPKLRDRTRYADYVLPVRVESVSRVGAEHEGTYELTLAPTGPALAGDHAGPVMITLPKSGPAYAWVEGAGSKFAGSRLIIFVKAFRNGESSVLHFRGEPDTPDVRQAVERDAGLRNLR